MSKIIEVFEYVNECPGCGGKLKSVVHPENHGYHYDCVGCGDKTKLMFRDDDDVFKDPPRGLTRVKELEGLVDSLTKVNARLLHERDQYDARRREAMKTAEDRRLEIWRLRARLGNGERTGE